MPTTEVLGAHLCLTNPRSRLVDLPPARVINPAFAVAETLWILSGSDDPWIFQYNRALTRYTDDGGLQGVYGPRMRRWRGRIDQLDQVRRLLDRDPRLASGRDPAVRSRTRHPRSPGRPVHPGLPVLPVRRPAAHAHHDTQPGLVARIPLRRLRRHPAAGVVGRLAGHRAGRVPPPRRLATSVREARKGSHELWFTRAYQDGDPTRCETFGNVDLDQP